MEEISGSKLLIFVVSGVAGFLQLLAINTLKAMKENNKDVWEKLNRVSDRLSCLEGEHRARCDELRHGGKK